MTFVNTRNLFLAIDTGAPYPAMLRWGFWRWEGCIFRNRTPAWLFCMRQGTEGFLHLGPFVFGWARTGVFEP